MSNARPSLAERLYGRPWWSALVIAAVLFVAYMLVMVLPQLAILVGYFLATVAVVRVVIALSQHLTRGRRGSSV